MTGNKILIITRNFPPLTGGMERLLEHAVGQLSIHHPCTLIGPRGCENFTPPHTQARSCQVAPLSFFLLQAMWHSLASGARNKYRFSLAGSGLTAPLVGMAKLRYRIPAIAFVHGLDLISDNQIYQRFFVPWLGRMDLVIANSHNTATLAESKGVSRERIRILHPGVSLPVGQDGNETAFLAKHNLVGKKILLSVGRLIPRKGLAEFLQHSFPAIVASCPDTVLVIIGAEPGNALKRADGTNLQIKQIVASRSLDKHLRFLGKVDDATLAHAYAAANLLIFPVRDIPGDVEGFGMVAIEAAAHGLPTLAFAAGGVPDAIEDNRTGFLVGRDNYREFADIAVRFLTGKHPHVTKANCRQFARRFEWASFGEQLIEICSSLDRDRRR